MMPPPNRKFSELRISQAYLKLLSIPESADGARTVSLERIGNHEIRMFESAASDSTEGPLFWMELFNLDRQASVDSCSCDGIEEAAIAFEGFVAQAREPDEPSPGGRDAPQG